MAKKNLSLTRFLGRLRGQSQPILAETSDGQVMVVKFRAYGQGPNLLFNEAMGSELFAAAGLSVPSWAPVIAPEAFLDANPACWRVEGAQMVPPQSGPAFASSYIYVSGERVTQILPGSSLSRVERAEEFWLAWLIDVCAQHVDHRQALFVEQASRRLRAIFIDHGQMFGGATGELEPRFRASRFLDQRLYPEPTPQMKERILQRVESINLEKLCRKAARLPEEWKTPLAAGRFAACLGRLSKPSLLGNTLDTLFDDCRREGRNEPPFAKIPVQSEHLASAVDQAEHGSQPIAVNTVLYDTRFA